MNRRYAGRLLWAVALLLPLLAAAGAAYGAEDAMIVDVAPFIENGVIYDTVRPIAETFGVYVSWDQAEQKVTLTRGACQVVMEVGSPELTQKTLDGVKVIPISAPPVLRDGRVMLPVGLWADAFGFQVDRQKDSGSVTVSEGEKSLTVTPGQKEFKLTGGYFLKAYYQDESLSFYYPAIGTIDVVWEGYAEVLMKADGDDYVVVAVNAGAGRSDPIHYTQEELDILIHQNADHKNTNVERLPEGYYGVPAFKFSGPEAGVPQAGVIFLKNGALCGLTVEIRKSPGSDVFQGNTLEIVNEDGTDVVVDKVETPTEADPAVFLEKLKIVNAILDEIMASFTVF